MNKSYNRKVCPPGLACRLGRRCCRAAVSTGHPCPLRQQAQYYCILKAKLLNSDIEIQPKAYLKSNRIHAHDFSDEE